VGEQPEDKYNLVVLGRELIRFDIYYEEAEQRDAPESLKSVHETLLTGLREYKLAAEDVGHFADHIVEGEESLFASAELYEKWRELHR
jgi:hypothetical protein